MTALCGARSQRGIIAHTRAPIPVLMGFGWGRGTQTALDKWGWILAGEPLGWVLLCRLYVENQQVLHIQGPTYTHCRGPRSSAVSYQALAVSSRVP